MNIEMTLIGYTIFGLVCGNLGAFLCNREWKKRIKFIIEDAKRMNEVGKRIKNPFTADEILDLFKF